MQVSYNSTIFSSCMKRLKIKKTVRVNVLLITIFISLFSIQAKAQNTSLKTWLGVAYERDVKIKDFKFEVSAEQQFRISNFIYLPSYSLLSELGLSKKLTDFYKIGVSYRASYIGGLEHRASINNSFKVEKDDFTFSFRLKYQAEFEKREAFSQDFRLKTTIEYKANKDFRPYVFGEILYNDTYNFSNFNEYRVGLGLDADYKKDHRFDVGLFYARDINIDRPEQSIVLSLAYKFSK